MKKAFSLLEIIFVVVIIAIISSFIITKSNNTIDTSIKIKIKSEIALIRNQITKQITKNILLKSDSIFTLDSEGFNENKSKLFANILDFPLISTNTNIKEPGKWIKISDYKYQIFLNNNDSLEFAFEDNSFVCKSEVLLCSEYE